MKYHLKETQQHLSAPPPMKSKLQRKYNKPFLRMDGTLFHSAQPRQKYTFNFDLLGGRGGQVLLDVFAMVLYFTNTGVRKVVVNKNAILHPGHWWIFKLSLAAARTSYLST